MNTLLYIWDVVIVLGGLGLPTALLNKMAARA